IGTVAYDGFGNITTESSPTNTGNLTFTGLTFLRNAGLLGAHERVYDPLTGTWRQQDPDRFGAGDAKLDRYVRNNSTNATDPSGLWPIDGMAGAPAEIAQARRERYEFPYKYGFEHGKAIRSGKLKKAGYYDNPLSDALYRDGLEDGYFRRPYNPPGDRIHYPVSRIEGGLKVALITHDTQWADDYSWVPDDNIQYNITVWGRVAIWLKTYEDNSISCLILSGEGLGPGECGVKVKGGKLYQGNITEEVIKLIKRKVVPNGDVVISSCCSGNSPEAVEQLVGKLNRDVSVTTGC